MSRPQTRPDLHVELLTCHICKHRRQGFQLQKPQVETKRQRNERCVSVLRQGVLCCVFFVCLWGVFFNAVEVVLLFG